MARTVAARRLGIVLLGTGLALAGAAGCGQGPAPDDRGPAVDVGRPVPGEPQPARSTGPGDRLGDAGCAGAAGVLGESPAQRCAGAGGATGD